MATMAATPTTMSMGHRADENDSEQCGDDGDDGDDDGDDGDDDGRA